MESIAVAARSLALAEETGMDLVTPCSSCFVTLYRANLNLKENPEIRAQVNEALAIANLEYRGNLQVRQLVDVLVKDITPETITARVRQPLNDLKVAPYYGCQLARPDYGLDEPESPRSLDRLVECLGAEAVPFPLKDRCCGGNLTISSEELALDLIRKLLASATVGGAQCIVTPCPLCQINVDAFQSRVNSRFRTNYKLPVLFITQLIGLALGINPNALGLDTNIVSPRGVLDYLRSYAAQNAAK
jgi:heterodisulfide reductase subunit B